MSEEKPYTASCNCGIEVCGPNAETVAETIACHREKAGHAVNIEPPSTKNPPIPFKPGPRGTVYEA